MSDCINRLSEGMHNLDLCGRQGHDFLQSAMDDMSRLHPTWRDESKPSIFIAKCMENTELSESKTGDEAEEKVLQSLSKLPDLLGEHVFIISGREYCLIKEKPEQQKIGWVLGEHDIILMSRKLGVINIEVKDRKPNTKVLRDSQLFLKVLNLFDMFIIF